MKANIIKNRTGIIGIAAVIACAIVLVSAPVFATIVLEIHSNTTDGDTSFMDSSPGTTPHGIFANGEAKHSTDAKRFGTSSIYFNGTGEYLSIQDSPDWDFGSGDFTIDTWFKRADSGNPQAIWTWRIAGEGTNQFNAEFNNNTTVNGIRMYMFNSASSNYTFAGSTAIIDTNWHHLALVRNGGTVTIYLDGEDDGSQAVSGSFDMSARAFHIASYYTGTPSLFYKGYIDDFYIRKGEALDAADLTYIIANGGRMFEAERYIDSANTTWGLGYNQVQIDQLAELYSNGKYGQSPADVAIGGITWSYMDGELPGDLGGTKAIGESYMHEGKWYIKLGSGLEGVPELPVFAPFISLLFGIGIKLKRRKK